jgi:DNA polymerase-3 subunit epsilon
MALTPWHHHLIRGTASAISVVRLNVTNLSRLNQLILNQKKMKTSNYYAVDVETSGLNPKDSSILAIGAVDIATGALFYEECQIWQGAYVSSMALAINGFTLESITDSKKKTEAQIIAKFFQWLGPNPLMIAHNASFDWGFINEAASRAQLNNPFNFRTICIHAISQVEMLKNGDEVPSQLGLNKCLEYFGFPKEPTPHNALTGAKCNTSIFKKIVYGTA